MGRSGMQRQQSDLHVSASPKLNKISTALHTLPSRLTNCYATVSFSKVSTMGIKGGLPADIGQLTDLQSLYVAAEHYS